MRQVKANVVFKTVPLIYLVMAGMFLSSISPVFASKFPPRKAPSSNSSGGRRAVSLCHPPEVASASTPDSLPVRIALAGSDPQTLLVQVPATSAQQAMLKLEDAQGNYLYHTQFPLAPTTRATSVTQLPLPETAVTLKPGQPYRWSLGIICNQTIDPNDPVFEGWL